MAEFCKIEAQIGAEYLAAKAALREGDRGMEAWAEEHLPGLLWRRIQYCAKFAGLVEQFDPAHDWYVGLKPAERRAGWKTANETGARYGIQVIELYRRFRDGFGPPQPKKKREAEGKSRAAALDQQLGEATAILAEAEAKAARLETENQRLRARSASLVRRLNAFREAWKRQRRRAAAS